MIVKKENGFLKLKKDGIKEAVITVFNKENNKKLYRIQAGTYRESMGQLAYDELTNDKGIQISEVEDKKEGKKRGRPSGSKNQNKQEQPQQPQQPKETPPEDPVNEEQINPDQGIENQPETEPETQVSENDEQNENEKENESVPGQMEIDQQ